MQVVNFWDSRPARAFESSTSFHHEELTFLKLHGPAVTVEAERFVMGGERVRVIDGKSWKKMY